MFRVVRCVIMMTIFMMDIMTITRTILTMIQVIFIVTLMCMALLSQMIMSCAMIFMSWMTVGCIVYLRVTPYWTGDEEGDVYEGDVALPRTGSDELVNSVACTSGLVGPGGPRDEAADVCEGDVALPRTGSDEPVNSVVHTSGPDGPDGPCDEDGDIYECDVALHQTSSDKTVNNVVSTACPGAPRDETGSVADTPGDVIAMSSECQEIDKGTLDKIRTVKALYNEVEGTTIMTSL